jgi:cytoskeletal protein CcmA (bactofilin family)
LQGAEIAGELVANIKGGGTIRIKSTGRLFGDVQAQNIVIEPGAIIVGAMNITPPPPVPRLSMSNVPV